MRTDNIPVFLRTHALDDLVVEFEDGDNYPAAALDLQGENDEGEFEIGVSFRDCLGKSRTQARALETGSSEGYPGVWWTSDEPSEPVGMQYMPDQVISIYDNEKGCFAFERERSV